MTRKYVKKKSGLRKFLWIPVIIIVAILFITPFFRNHYDTQVHNTDIESVESSVSEIVVPENTESTKSTDETTLPQEDYLLSVDDSIKIVEIGSYSGPYNEDGSDDTVENVMQILVKNIGNAPLQYAKFTLSGDTEEAVFVMTTLLPGESMYVLEANRKSYSEENVYSVVNADNIAYFMYEPSVHEDKFRIQPLDGGFNIKNISGEDIDGKIAIYFKDYDDDVYMGGITYSGTIKDGLKAGETKQIMSENFTAANTKVVFINIG